MFVRLGLLNSSRQLGRSLLVVLTMALAAVSLTSALSFSKGIMPKSNMFYRSLIGGEILVVPVRWAGQEQQGSQLELRKLQRSGLSWLEAIYPELYSEGYPAPQEASKTRLDDTDLTQLKSFPGVAAVNSVPVMPASLHKQKDGINYEFEVMLCPAPDTELLPQGLSRLLTQGGDIAIKNKFTRYDELRVSQIVSTIPDETVIGNAGIYPTFQEIQMRKENIARKQLAEIMKLPGKDDKVTLRVPSFRLSAKGELIPDFSRQISRNITIVGEAAIPTREIWVADSHGNPAPEQGFLHLPLVWVPETTWEELWADAAAGEAYRATTVALKVDDLSRLEDTVLNLQHAFPHFAFESVTKLASRLESGGLIDYFYTVPEVFWRPSKGSALSMPVSLSQALGVLMYLVAGMFIASRMVTGAAARRKEIGVLKALGGRRRDIITMALSEAFLVAFIGNTVGFLLVKGVGVFMELSNKVPLSEVLMGVAGEYWLVTGVAVLTSIVFALIPAIRMANLTVMEVLRHE